MRDCERKYRQRGRRRRHHLRAAAAAQLTRGQRDHHRDRRTDQRRGDPQRERRVADREQPGQQRLNGGWSTYPQSSRLPAARK